MPMLSRSSWEGDVQAHPNGVPAQPSERIVLPSNAAVNDGREALISLDLSQMVGTNGVQQVITTNASPASPAGYSVAHDCDVAMTVIDRTKWIASINEQHQQAMLPDLEPFIDPTLGPDPMERYLAESPYDEGQVLPHEAALSAVPPDNTGRNVPKFKRRKNAKSSAGKEKL